MAETKKPIYKVETVRDAQMIKSFILFTYRQSHPKVTRNFLLIGIVSLILTIGIRVRAVGIFLIIQGIFCIAMALFRHHIPVSTIKRNDADFRDKNTLTYEFREHKVDAFRNGEKFLSIVPYSNITNLCHDEKYFYLGANEDDFMMLPKKDFVTGDPDTFVSFIEKKAKIQARWSPASFSERRKQNKEESVEKHQKMEAARRAQMEAMAEQKAEQRAMVKEAWNEKKKKLAERRAKEGSADTPAADEAE